MAEEKKAQEELKEEEQGAVSSLADQIEDEDLSKRVATAEQFFQKNRNNLIYLAIAIGVALFGGFYWYNSQQEAAEEAQKEMFRAVFYFEKDSLNLALNGDGLNKGFLEIIDDYSGTGAAQLANYYAGATYMLQGKYQDAIPYLEDFSGNDAILQARAYSLIGDANMELGNYGESEQYYKKASEYKPNEQFTPIYLMKLALAYEAQNKWAEAADTYDIVKTKYYTSSEAPDARKYYALAKAKAGND